jgi:hypothetical protein
MSFIPSLQMCFFVLYFTHELILHNMLLPQPTSCLRSSVPFPLVLLVQQVPPTANNIQFCSLDWKLFTQNLVNCISVALYFAKTSPRVHYIFREPKKRKVLFALHNHWYGSFCSYRYAENRTQ